MKSLKKAAAALAGGAAAVAGLSLATPPAAHGAPVEIQILATNDFHGRIKANGTEAGAAVMAGAVKQLRAENPNTVFAAAGDLIGASTFESFIAHDKPTIDALNEAGLDVSAVGNHELDAGYNDLVNRVMAPYDATTNPEGGAAWEYIASNITEPAGQPDKIAESWIQDFGGVQVGFVGAVTEDLPALVSPAGIEGLTVQDIVASVNAETAALKAAGAEAVVMLVHEGSASTDCASPSFTDANTTWGNIVQNVSADVDAIVSGHTHLAYNCTINGRPVVSAGQYGTNLNQLTFSIDDVTGEVGPITQNIIALAPGGTAAYPADQPTADIVAAAVANAEVLGAEVLGELGGDVNRAKLANGTTENRGGESTIGNLVAEVQQWATEESHGAQIAFMNPGGLRQDMLAGELTYKEAAVVQPFANTLVNMDLTGAQIEAVLEQQWQRAADGTVPSRPFLRLGVSEGFRYTYTETPVTVGGTSTFSGEVTGMWLNGTPIDPAATYSVTVNSFLASGGDNFRVFANGANRVDTGRIDLSAMVDYMAAMAPVGSPLRAPVDQRAVEVTAPQWVSGGKVSLRVESWSMSTAADAKDDEIQVMLDGQVIGTATLDNTVTNDPYDNTGTATITVTLPRGTRVARATLMLVGATTGTEVAVPLRFARRK